MKITARLATGWTAPAVHAGRPSPSGEAVNPRPGHPILRDQPAIEAALATVLLAGKNDAIRRGVTPEQDVAAAAFRAEHGALAACIVDPVGEACAGVAAVLLAHLKSIVSDDELHAAALRIGEQTGGIPRYGRQAEVWH